LSLNELFKNNKLKQLLFILLAQGIFMLCNLYINHWVSKSWNVEGFAIFNLIKRISSFIAFPLLIGAGIGIPKYISFLKGRSKSHSYEYLLSGVMIFFITFLLFILIITIFPAIVPDLLSEGDMGENAIFCTCIFIFSQGHYILLNSYYRGKMQFEQMSLLNVLVMSFLPLACLFFVDNVFTYFYFLSISSLIVVVFLMGYLGLGKSISLARIKLKGSRLVNFGYPRIIGELGLFSLEFLPIFLVGVYIGLPESGYLSMSFILLKLAAMCYELVGSLILPYFGKFFKTAPFEKFVLKVNRLLIIGFVSSIVVAIGFYFLLPVAVETFFPSLTKTIFSSQMIFIAFPIFAIYLLLRNILDIVADKAYNSINLAIVFIVQIIILAIGIYFKNYIVYSILSIVIPYFILGVLTYRVWNYMKGTLRNAK